MTGSIPERAADLAARTRQYFENTLLPFWLDNARDPDGPGFLHHFDAHGQRTGRTDKSLLGQLRLVFSLSYADRYGYGDGRAAELASAGARFVRERCWDDEHGGWFWVLDREGAPLDTHKIGYGHAFAMYAFGEHFRATGDEQSLEAMRRTRDCIRASMSDPAHGGYREMSLRDWSPTSPGRGGGDRKSFDVHMHLLEAFTTVVHVTEDAADREELAWCVDHMTTRMLNPDSGGGFQQFAFDWTPLPGIRFDTFWGRDEEPDGGTLPLDWLSYGHDMEFAWLLIRALDELGESRERAQPFVEQIARRCVDDGLDPEYGGVYVGGDPRHGATHCKKQFWQQAEVLVGLLATFDLLGDVRYFEAFESLHEYVFATFVNHEGGGEWYGLLERDGSPLDTYVADNFKISYHTVRAMVEVVARLESVPRP